jgi:hypothetical protein
MTSTRKQLLAAEEKSEGQLARKEKAAKRKADQRRRHEKKEKRDLDNEEEDEFFPSEDSSTSSMSERPARSDKRAKAASKTTEEGPSKTTEGGKKGRGRLKNDQSDDEEASDDDIVDETPSKTANGAVQVSSPETEKDEEAETKDQEADEEAKEAQPTDGKDATIAKLKQELALAHAAKASSGGRKVKKAEMTPEEKLWAAQIKHAVVNGVWHLVRFCNTEERLIKCTRKVMRFMKLDAFKDLKGRALLKKESKWIVENKELVRTSINTMRNDVSGHIRKEYIDRVAKPVTDEALKWKPDWYHGELTDKQTVAIHNNVGKEKEDRAKVLVTNLRLKMELCVPTLQDIQDCIEREPYLMTTDKGQAIFDDFVDRWLLKTAGKANWDVDKRHHETVSLARREDDGRPCIDEGMEAMCFMFFENQHYRHAGLAVAKLGGPAYPAKNNHASPWTCSDGGQLRFGGWTEEGQERFKIMRTKVEESRKRPHVKKMEADCLTRLRIKHGLEEAEGAEGDAPAAKRPKLATKFAPAEDSDNDLLD